MKKEITIKFVDFWEGFDEKDNFITNCLSEKYNVLFSDKPDYLFFSLFGNMNIGYDCVKIFFSGENSTPNFNFTDYAIGFNHLTLQDRYIRIPLYVTYDAFETIRNEKIIDREKLLNRKFCSFVYSNNTLADNTRIDFYHTLSKYKKIDSGGSVLNNVNGKVPNKLEFIKDYKFNIAFENSIFDGYTTEKIMEPMCVNSLPIYWGNPSVGQDFNSKSFINAADFDTLEELAEYIVYLDRNDDAYIEKLSEPWFLENNMLDWKDKLKNFLHHIIEQEPTKAKRIPQNGWALHDFIDMKRLIRQDNFITENPRCYKYMGKLSRFPKKIKKLFIK